MKFSIIIPTYNRPKLLINCLESLLNQNYPKNDYEIIVVDDHSKEDIFKVIKKLKSKNIKFFRHEKNKGQGIARNLGLKNAKGKIIAFTDDDCVVERDWLRKIESVFDKNKVDVVGGSIINPTKKYIAWSQYLLNFSTWLPKGKNRFVKDIPTANIAYLKSAIDGNFFPERLSSLRYEESLYNYELCKKGKKILFCPWIKVKHFTWDENYGLKKFFDIQNKAGLGFVKGGYKVHGKIGNILIRFKILNLFCPRIIPIFKRCLKYGYLFEFIICFPLILAGEFYKGWIILFYK